MAEISDAVEDSAIPNEVPNDFINTISGLVGDGNFDHIDIILKEGKHDKKLSDITWDLVPLLCTFLTEANQADKPDTIKSCEFVFDRLCQAAKPKELILVLLEQANAFCDDVRFKVLLPPIQKSLLSLSAKRSHSLAMALETLYAHIQTVPLPDADIQDLEGKERVMLHMDPATRRVCDVVTALLEFLVPFVNSATSDSDNYEERSKERNDIVKTLTKILNHPLVHLDLSHKIQEVKLARQRVSNGPTKNLESNLEKPMPKSESRLVAEKVAELLGQLQPDYLKLIAIAEQHNARREARLKEIRSNVDENASDLEDADDYGVEEEIPALGLSCLVYLTLGEQLGMRRFPCVYTPHHILEFALPFACAFIEKPVTFHIEKGLKLLRTTVFALPDLSLTAEFMGFDTFVNSTKYLIKVVIHCPSKLVRQEALQLFPLILSKFEYKGRYLYLQYLLNKADHSGLIGYTTGLLKDQIDATLKEETPCVYFTGSYLEKLLNYVFVLPEGATSDLLEESDRVLGALNLLRYLLLRDNPKQNLTGIWNFIADIDEKYCRPLRTGVNMSRAHYKLEMDKTKAGEYLPKPGDPEMEVTIGTEHMPNLTQDQQLQVIQRALFTFDMIDSVLARVSELVDQQKKPTSE